MSRVYDALKQAGRAHQIENPIPQVDALGLLRNDGPNVEPATAPGREERGKPQTDPWEISPEQELHRRASVVRNGSFGTDANILLDPTARLIPNATEAAVVEHYRRLRTKLVQQHATKPFRSVVVTSPNPQEGKTVTTLNLALSFAMLLPFKVAVVDGDLRRGSLGKWLGVKDHPGLGDLIEGTATLQDAVIKCDEIPIHFIVSGLSQRPAAELLHSRQLGELFQRMTEQFDLVLVDSPPVNLVTDGQLLAAACDAVLLVARAFSTTRKDLEKAVQDLQTFRIIGTVLNGGTRAQLYRRYNNGYY